MHKQHAPLPLLHQPPTNRRPVPVRKPADLDLTRRQRPVSLPLPHKPHQPERIGAWEESPVVLHSPLAVHLEDSSAVPVTSVELDLYLRPLLRLVCRRYHALPRRRHRYRLSFLALDDAARADPPVRRGSTSAAAAGGGRVRVRCAAIAAVRIFERVFPSISRAERHRGVEGEI